LWKRKPEISSQTYRKRFEGIINPDGGLWEGKLTNFPIPASWRESSVFDLPAVYTGAVEESILVDMES